MKLKAAALIASILIVTVPSHADDTSALDTSVPAPAPIWQGVYLAVSGGRFESNGTIANLANGRLTEMSKQGDGAGIYGGYNWQTGPLVLGIEGDWSSGRKQVGQGFLRCAAVPDGRSAGRFSMAQLEWEPEGLSTPSRHLILSI